MAAKGTRCAKLENEWTSSSSLYISTNIHILSFAFRNLQLWTQETWVELECQVELGEKFILYICTHLEKLTIFGNKLQLPPPSILQLSTPSTFSNYTAPSTHSKILYWTVYHQCLLVQPKESSALWPTHLGLPHIHTHAHTKLLYLQQRQPSNSLLSLSSKRIRFLRTSCIANHMYASGRESSGVWIENRRCAIRVDVRSIISAVCEVVLLKWNKRIVELVCLVQSAARPLALCSVFWVALGFGFTRVQLHR